MNRSWHIIGNGIEYESSCASGKSAITQTMIPTIEETCLEKSPLWVNVHDFFCVDDWWRNLSSMLVPHCRKAPLFAYVYSQWMRCAILPLYAQPVSNSPVSVDEEH